MEVSRGRGRGQRNDMNVLEAIKIEFEKAAFPQL